jgi:hypothetical protein
MHEISAIALFCSDVRQERGGTETIVGILPDNVNVPRFPGGFVQMTIYVRIHLSTTYHPAEIVARVVLPDGKELDRAELQPDLIEQSREKAKVSGAPYVGLLARFAVAPLRIQEPGQLQAIVSVDGVDIVAGVLNCRLKEASTSPTAS